MNEAVIDRSIQERVEKVTTQRLFTSCVLNTSIELVIDPTKECPSISLFAKLRGELAVKAGSDWEEKYLLPLATESDSQGLFNPELGLETGVGRIEAGITGLAELAVMGWETESEWENYLQAAVNYEIGRNHFNQESFRGGKGLPEVIAVCKAAMSIGAKFHQSPSEFHQAA